MVDNTQAKAEELVDKYLAHHEIGVRKGAVSPMNGVERLTIEIVFAWLCERYDVTVKR